MPFSLVDAEHRVTVYSWKALAGSVIGYSMDGFDQMILGFMLVAISADLALTSTQAGSLVTATLIGAVAGGFIFGSLRDKFGRMRVCAWTILVFALFTGLCAFSRSYGYLIGAVAGGFIFGTLSDKFGQIQGTKDESACN